jgi:hypothetical protein
MKIAYWLGSAGVMLALVLVASYWPRPLEFANLEDAAAQARAAGFFVTSDRADGNFQGGFLLSTDPVSFADASVLSKTGKMGPQWQNRLWVTSLPCSWATTPDEAVVKLWGNLVVFGDLELLRRVEAKLGCSSDPTECEMEVVPRARPFAEKSSSRDRHAVVFMQAPLR